MTTEPVPEPFPVERYPLEKAQEVYLTLIHEFFQELDPQPTSFRVKLPWDRKPVTRTGIKPIGSVYIVFQDIETGILVHFLKRTGGRDDALGRHLVFDRNGRFVLEGWTQLRELLVTESANLKAAMALQELGVHCDPSCYERP